MRELWEKEEGVNDGSSGRRKREFGDEEEEVV